MIPPFQGQARGAPPAGRPYRHPSMEPYFPDPLPPQPPPVPSILPAADIHSLATDIPLAAEALAEALDKRIMVQLRDRRTVYGILRSFDQHQNLLLENALERGIFGTKYFEKHLGAFYLRGDNMVLFAESDPTAEWDVYGGLERVAEGKVLALRKEHKEQEKLKGNIKALASEFLEYE